jgi:polysaccharide biosynthesis protein PslH
LHKTKAVLTYFANSLGTPKIISLVWYKAFPAQFGGQKAIADVQEKLATHWPLQCVCSHNNEAGATTIELNKILPTGKWQFINPFLWRKIRRAAKEFGCTHLLLEHPYYAWMAVWLRRRTGIRFIIRSHNIESQRFKSTGAWWWWILHGYESWAMRQANRVLFITQADLDFAVHQFRLLPQQVQLLPFEPAPQPSLSASEKALARQQLQAKHSIASHEKILLFNGSLDYAPNAKALEHLVQYILPILAQQNTAFRLLVCGRNELPAFQYLKNLTHSLLIQAGWVDAIAPYFAGADLMLNPVTIGGGVKVKVLEALSYGLPVVSYANGAIGVPATPQLLVVPNDDAAGFAKAVVEVLGMVRDMDMVRESRTAADVRNIAEDKVRVPRTSATVSDAEVSRSDVRNTAWEEFLAWLHPTP